MDSAFQLSSPGPAMPAVPCGLGRAELSQADTDVPGDRLQASRESPGPSLQAWGRAAPFQIVQGPDSLNPWEMKRKSARLEVPSFGHGREMSHPDLPSPSTLGRPALGSVGSLPSAHGSGCSVLIAQPGQQAKSCLLSQNCLGQCYPPGADPAPAIKLSLLAQKTARPVLMVACGSWPLCSPAGPGSTLPVMAVLPGHQAPLCAPARPGNPGQVVGATARCFLFLENYDDLYHWSVASYSDFWAEFWRFSGIVFSHEYDEVVDTSKGISDVPEWFRGSRLNYAENLLRHKENDKVALYVAREGKEEITKVTFEELRQQVALFAAAMRKMGVQKGDRVVGYLPNSVHAVEAMLAAASIGAIWSSTSPDFGVNGVLDRFSQIHPKLIFSVEAVIYNGKEHSHMEKLQQVVKGLPDLRKVVVIPYVSSREKIDLSRIPSSVFLDDFLASGTGELAPQLEFEQLPFSHPLFIMFSSGTTGAPKCMVHSAGGTLIQHLKEHMLHGNMTCSDVVLYYTTVGWMMWNWMVSALATGASLVLYDGSPLVPTPSVLWDLVDRIGITVLGTSAKWLSILQEKDLKPAETHNLQTLHTILATGSLLKAQSYEYVYSCVKSSVLLGSISGGTDIISCFMGHNTSVPVYKGEIQARNLAMAVEAWNEEGRAVWGDSGELVCTKPVPCQPTHFWNDENGSKYRQAYFSKFPGVWAHGDYCRMNPKTGGIIMLGRSDGTLNPNGVRFGSSEIYNIVEAFEEVGDSLCIPQYNRDGEERVILFLKMASGHAFRPDLVKRIRDAIRLGLSPRHVPSLILETQGIPYTLNGKKVEVAVKEVVAGKVVEHRGAFSNPETLDLYRNVPELQGF
ncbi:acetoacetyl-CoA synthetase [Fukomys damarensis]|uniref:acetoacetyl-CoA synthetase n=1 Tax=Fukomys damarensis TaxID=885580 RepID=UPI00053F4748|nr:acetoacetyl-CoA synthetase [Fukomys damarensis]